MNRHALLAFALLRCWSLLPSLKRRKLPSRSPARHLFPPKAWIVVNAKTGKVLQGGNEAEPRPMASTSKIMTAWIVLQLAAADAKVLDEVGTFSENADKTPGSSSELAAGEKVAVKELLYGLLLPSGNDAAVSAGRTLRAAVRKRRRRRRLKPVHRGNEPPV